MHSGCARFPSVEPVRFASRVIRVLASLLLIIGCSEQEAVSSNDTRWYSPEHVALGERVFQTHCASCHGARAEATPEWREPGLDGNYPPPPLNGSAHAWHHSLGVLKQTIADGGVPLGGVMPAFGDVLSDQEQLAAIAYFQSFWADQIYARWRQMDVQ